MISAAVTKGMLTKIVGDTPMPGVMVQVRILFQVTHDCMDGRVQET